MIGRPYGVEDTQRTLDSPLGVFVGLALQRQVELESGARLISLQSAEETVNVVSEGSVIVIQLRDVHIVLSLLDIIPSEVKKRAATQRVVV
jgi:hypothetical protein